MATTTPSKRRTRRSFIATAGTALSAPIAAAAASGTPAVDAADPAARLQRLEALEAIRGLNDAYARLVNAGNRDAAATLFVDPATAALDPAVRGLLVDPLAGADAIELAPDGRSASARLRRVVEAEEAIGPSCPLVEMAREQGGGVIRRREHAIFETTYAKQAGAWKIQASVRRTTAV